MPTQIRKKTYDELLAENDRLRINAEVSRLEIIELHKEVASLTSQLAEAHATIERQNTELDAIGAGGVSSQRITGTDARWYAVGADGQATLIELPPLPSPFGIVDPMGSGEKIYTLKDMGAYARAYARSAIEADRQRRQSEAEEVCGEAYQVVGSLLSDLGIFETDHAKKILDNLSQAKMVHKDVLPWPSFDLKRRGEPVYLLAETDGMWSETNEATFLWWKANSPRAARVLYTAPQPAESCASLMSDKTACGSENGKCDSQPAEPVNKTDWSAELSSWSDEDFIQVFHERPDLANRLRKMPAEPVKVPSDAISVVGVPEFDALMDHIYENGTASEGVLPLANAFARALLARYGQPVEPVKPCLIVKYDEKGDSLYICCDSSEPTDAEENEQGILLWRAYSDGRLVGVTIPNFMGPMSSR